MAEDALYMSWVEFLDYGHIRPTLLSCVHPSIYMHEIQTHRQEGCKQRVAELILVVFIKQCIGQA